MTRKSDKLLVIRLSSMGDVAMTVPVLIALLKKYPELQVYFLTRKLFFPFFEALPQVECVALEPKEKHKGLAGLYRLYKQLNVLGIQQVMDLHNVLRTKILKQLFGLQGVPVVQLDKGRKEKKGLTRKANKNLIQLTSTHERYAEVFAKSGYPVQLDDSCILKRETVPEAIQSALGGNIKKWVGIAPFAAYPGKTYPLDLLKALVEILVKEANMQLFLFGAPDDAALLSGLSTSPGVRVMAGNYSFREELAVISNLDLMVSMDSANGHLAAMYGVKVISVWGVTHPFAGFSPFGQAEDQSLLPDLEAFPEIPTSVYGNKCPEGYQEAIRTVTPERIARKITTLLNR